MKQSRRTSVRILAVLSICILSTAGFAQSKKPSPAATAIDPELAEAIKIAPTAAQWPNNNYSRLLDLESVELKADGTVIADYRESIKLFNERGRSMAEVNLPYN